MSNLTKAFDEYFKDLHADPYASEEETQALLVPDTRTAAERTLAQMMTERGADEQGAEVMPILRQIALELLESKPTFTGLPKRKLDMLLKTDWRINGVSIEYTERDGTVLRGAVTTGGMVLWWNQEQKAQSQHCSWKQTDIDHMPDTWAGDCGALWSFIESGPNANDMRFCPSCGKPAVEAATKGVSL